MCGMYVCVSVYVRMCVRVTCRAIVDTQSQVSVWTRDLETPINRLLKLMRKMLVGGEVSEWIRMRMSEVSENSLYVCVRAWVRMCERVCVCQTYLHLAAVVFQKWTSLRGHSKNSGDFKKKEKKPIERIFKSMKKCHTVCDHTHTNTHNHTLTSTLRACVTSSKKL